MLDGLKLVGAPGSIPFFVLSILAGLALIRFSSRFRRAGVVWLISVTATYTVLALPLVANAIAAALPAVAPSSPTTTVSTLVVLDGDNRRGRVRELQRVVAAESPSTVWVLGGRWILEALGEVDVAGPAFRHDATAATTRDQIVQVREIANRASGHTAVIASRLQAARVSALARAQNIAVTVLPSAIDSEPPTTGFARFVPAYIALRVSRDAIYEHLALAYYRVRHWIE